MRLVECIEGNIFKIKDIKEKQLNSKLLGLGICKGDSCSVENIGNGNMVVKTPETKIAISLNLADKIDIEVIK